MDAMEDIARKSQAMAKKGGLIAKKGMVKGLNMLKTLKNKGKLTLVTGLQRAKSAVRPSHKEEAVPQPDGTLKPRRVRRNSEEILKGLDPAFFTEEFDPVKFMLEHLPEKMQESRLEAEIEQKDLAKEMVSLRLSRQVLANYASFVQGMQHVRDVELDLQKISSLCNGGRKQLAKADKDLAQSLFPVLFKARKKKRLAGIHNILCKVRILLDQEKERQRLLESGDFSAAVEVYYQSMRSLKVLHQNRLTCIDGLYERVQRGKAEISSKAYARLTDFTRGVDTATIANVVHAYDQLGDLLSLAGHMKKAFVDSVLSVCYATCDKFMLPEKKGLYRAKNANRGVSQSQKQIFLEYCSRLDVNQFSACYLLVAENTIDLLFLYHKCVCALEELIKNNNPAVATAEKLQPVLLEAFQNKEVVWGVVQDRLSWLLQSAPLSTKSISLDEFLKLLHFSSRIIAIGEHFSGSKAVAFNTIVQNKSTDYVGNFHRENFEELRQTLADEQWKPWSEGFSIAEIPELRQQVLVGAASVIESDAETFKNFTTGVNIFRANRLQQEAVVAEAKRKEDMAAKVSKVLATKAVDGGALSGRDSRSREESKLMPDGTAPPATATATGTGTAAPKLTEGAAGARPRGKAPTAIVASAGQSFLLTCSSVKLARCSAKYLHIMETFPSMAVNALYGMAELFDLYIYTIFNLFGVGADRFYKTSFSLYPRLRTVVLAIRGRIEQDKFGKSTTMGGGVQQLATFMMTLDDATKEFSTQDTIGPNSNSLSLGYNSLSLSLPPTTASTASMSAKSNASSPHSSPPQSPRGGDSKDASESTPTTPAVKKDSWTASLRSTTAMEKKQPDNLAARLKAGIQTALKAGNEPKPAPMLVSLHPDVQRRFQREKLNGLLERVTASESTVFIVHFMQSLQDRMYKHLPQDEHKKVDKYLGFTQEVTQDFRRYMHRNLAKLVINMKEVVENVSKVNWTTRNDVTKPSAYTKEIEDKLLFAKRVIDDMPKELEKTWRDVTHIIWKEVTEYMMEELLHAFCSIKEVSRAGRNLMSADLTVINAKLEKLTGLDRIPKYDLVNKWVTALFIPKLDDLFRWMIENPDYNEDQYQALASLSVGADGKKKQERETLRRQVSQVYDQIVTQPQ